MKNKVKIILRNILLPVILVFIILTIQASAQKSLEVNDNFVFLPSEEVFLEIDALAVPWRNSGCHTNFEHNEPDCHQVTDKEWFSLHTLTLYDENASVWYRFSVSPESQDHFYKKKKKDFLPFGTGFDEYYPKVVYLRLVGESPHWYKVEVNEETQATKYILKSDPMWAKTSWNYWLFFAESIKVDFEKTPLYDKPNGQIIDEVVGGLYTAAMMIKTDGDWAYVKTRGSAIGNYGLYTGWVRWRKGRTILVKLVFDVTGGLPSTTSGK